MGLGELLKEVHTSTYMPFESGWTGSCCSNKCRKWPYLPEKRKKMNRKGSKWQMGIPLPRAQIEGLVWTRSKRWRESRGEATGKLWGKQREATETKGRQNTSIHLKLEARDFAQNEGHLVSFTTMWWHGFWSLLPLSELSIHSVTWKLILYFNPKFTALADIQALWNICYVLWTKTLAS